MLGTEVRVPSSCPYEAECPVCKKKFRQRAGGVPVCCSRSCARAKDWWGKPRKDTFPGSNGYIIKRVPPDYPGAVHVRRGKVGGLMLEHRYVMAEHLGRPLTKNDKVHHKNGKRDDNRIENLELWTVSHPAGVRVSEADPHCPTCACFHE